MILGDLDTLGDSEWRHGSANRTSLFKDCLCKQYKQRLLLAQLWRHSLSLKGVFGQESCIISSSNGDKQLYHLKVPSIINAVWYYGDLFLSLKSTDCITFVLAFRDVLKSCHGNLRIILFQHKFWGTWRSPEISHFLGHFSGAFHNPRKSGEIRKIGITASYVDTYTHHVHARMWE